MDGKKGGAAEIKRSESPSCVVRLRIGHHVNLNLFRESRKHTARENKALSGNERDLRSLSSCFLCHPLRVGSARCRQQPGKPAVALGDQPLNHSIHLAQLLLMCHLFLSFDSCPHTSSLLNDILPNSTVWTSSDSSCNHPLYSEHFSLISALLSVTYMQ